MTLKRSHQFLLQANPLEDGYQNFMLEYFCSSSLIERFSGGRTSTAFTNWGYQITIYYSGSARTLDPTNKNYAPELSTFGIIIEVNQSEVQWTSLTLGEPPSWSGLTPVPGKYDPRRSDISPYTCHIQKQLPCYWGEARTKGYLQGLSNPKREILP